MFSEFLAKVSTKFSPNVHCWMFTEYPRKVLERSLNVHWMFTECPLNVHWMFTECSLNVLGVFTEYSLSVHWRMFTKCSMNVCWLNAESFGMFSKLSLDVYKMITKNFWMFTECSLNVHLVNVHQMMSTFITTELVKRAPPTTLNIMTIWLRNFTTQIYGQEWLSCTKRRVPIGSIVYPCFLTASLVQCCVVCVLFSMIIDDDATLILHANIS
jgi:hypothetical protein